MEIEKALYGDCCVEEIKKGYIEDEEGFTCILCGEHFVKGEIYFVGNRFYEAFKAVQMHIEEHHGSVKDTLLKSTPNNMGISELQMQIINYFATGMLDKEIADVLGVSGSTIRNHRFKLREKERQCKLFLALMELLEEEGRTLQAKEMTRKEKRKILEKYMTPFGKLKKYPTYEQNKKIVLEAVLEHFTKGRKYSDDEINEKLKMITKDYDLLKEELITYNYLGRTNKGSVYWIKQH